MSEYQFARHYFTNSDNVDLMVKQGHPKHSAARRLQKLTRTKLDYAVTTEKRDVLFQLARATSIEDIRLSGYPISKL